jgi:hypothetical protein
VLSQATSREIVGAFRAIGQLRAFAQFTDDQIWQAIEAYRNPPAAAPSEEVDLKRPEWEALSRPTPARNVEDFRLAVVPPPAEYGSSFAQVVLAERLREVRALVGFTRIESPGDFGEEAYVAPERRAPLSRTPTRWLPASEVRGEGVFLEFQEDALRSWLSNPARRAQEAEFLEAHRSWRRIRRLDPVDAGFPGLRYVLLHTFTHALMRQLALECGYTAASIRERVYAAPPDDPKGPMAGVLLYTAAADSEGTLGGLVSLGEPARLGRLVDQALDAARLCASDPLCAEHHPWRDGQSLHAAACHACLFSPETSCERGNRYLDRALLVETVHTPKLAFFERKRPPA